MTHRTKTEAIPPQSGGKKSPIKFIVEPASIAGNQRRTIGEKEVTVRLAPNIATGAVNRPQISPKTAEMAKAAIICLYYSLFSPT